MDENAIEAVQTAVVAAINASDYDIDAIARRVKGLS